MNKKVFIFFLCVFISNIANAITGNELLKFCNSEDSFSQGMCLGYINGVSDRDLDASGCLPPDVTFGQMQKITEKYLDEHPKLLHLHATFLVMFALNDAFPCPKNKKG
jgi:hypothetical protein